MKISAVSLVLLIAILTGCGDSTSPVAPVRFAPIEVTLNSPATAEVRAEPPVPTGEAEAITADNSSGVAGDDLLLAARVNKQPILLETFEKQVTQLTQTLQAQGVDLTDEAGQETVVQLRRQVLEALIEQQIIEQQAEKLGITVTEETLEAKMQESMAQGQAEFEEWLMANDLTYEEFKRTLRSQLIANQVFEQITKTVPETAEQIHLSYIRVADEATAQTIIEQLKNGAEFTRLAQEYSLDESSRVNGGDLGWLPQGLGPIPPEVEARAFSLQPGQVSGPIQLALGFHIIKLEERETDRPLTGEMLQALKKQIFTDWLREQRLSTEIERFVVL